MRLQEYFAIILWCRPTSFAGRVSHWAVQTWR